jgi:hypothetical protein
MDHSAPILVLFVQEPRTEKQAGNAVSAQNLCSGTTLSRQTKQYATLASNNHNTDKIYSHLYSELHFLVLKYVGCFILYSSVKEWKYLNKINVFIPSFN